MAPWFEKMEQRLGVAPWAIPPNPNNDVLRSGCEARPALEGHPAQRARLLEPRLLRHGLPDQRQAVDAGHHHPATLDKGGELLYLARAHRLLIDGDKVTGIECQGMDERCVAPTGRTITVKARHYVLSGGGINTPACCCAPTRPTRTAAPASAPSCTW